MSSACIPFAQVHAAPLGRQIRETSPLSWCLERERPRFTGHRSWQFGSPLAHHPVLETIDSVYFEDHQVPDPSHSDADRPMRSACGSGTIHSGTIPGPIGQNPSWLLCPASPSRRQVIRRRDARTAPCQNVVGNDVPGDVLPGLRSVQVLAAMRDHDVVVGGFKMKNGSADGFGCVVSISSTCSW
jgi:hypothetical protein